VKLLTCVYIEAKKLFKSRIPIISLLALMLIPFIGGFFMFILKDPSLAESLGFISAKAQIMGRADWPSYLSLISQAISIGGIFAFGFISSWIFGREYADRTIKDLLALPISRTTIVLAKFLVTLIWGIFLSLLVLVLSLLVGYLVNITGFSTYLLFQAARAYMLSSLLTILLSSPVGFMASFSRGYLSPLAFIVFTLILAQIVATTGYGEFFPWSIPALIAVSIENPDIVLGSLSIWLVLFASGIGLLATIFWWKYADQH